MHSKWALQDAKNRFSELVDTAAREGPQTITRRGKDTAVLLSVDQFRNASWQCCAGESYTKAQCIAQTNLYRRIKRF